MFNRKLSRASLGLALSAALGAASLAFAQEPNASSYVRGASRFAAGDFAQATADFDAAIAARSGDPRVYYFRGLCAARQNDLATAAEFYATGARLEIETPQGRLVAVDAALKTIQGAERAPIEAARAKARADWKAKEADRQNALYGESLNRQRARLATPPKTTAAAQPASDKALAFPSIRPFFRGEIPAHQAPDPYDPNSDEFNYFREDLGKTSLSTRELKRLQDLAERNVYEDPMDRPAADGSPFVNIYDPSEVFVEDAPYASADDPDVLYEADEKNALNAMAVGCRLGVAALAKFNGVNDANGYGSGSSPYGSSSYGSSGYPSDYPGGPGSSDAAPKAVEPSKSDDTAKIFKGDEKPANPFGGKLELDKNNDFDLFPTGRGFKPTAPAPTDPYASGYSSGPH
ncbi:MAG: tetratricopeptide repeat protein [Thermoguttaceae bacterium]|nr:tetratricopeptide repeat protein [Thermoguttaceae bacterium]